MKKQSQSTPTEPVAAQEPEQLAPAAAVEEQAAQPEAATPSPEEALAVAQAQAAEYLDGWQRARAELANYRRRVEAQRAEMAMEANAGLLERLLPLLDDLLLALNNTPTAKGEPAGDGAWEEWRSGIALIAHKFASTLESVGVTPIQTEGQHFDPAVHEAVTLEEHAEVESGKIIAQLRQGYRLGDRVLRAAMVRVAR